MRIIGIDFGLKRIGIAWSAGFFAEPLTVITSQNRTQALDKLKTILDKESASLIVIGLPDGSLNPIVQKFGGLLSKFTGVPVEFWDETLTSKEAERNLIQSGRGRKDRQKRIDAVSAALILQSYLRSKELARRDTSQFDAE